MSQPVSKFRILTPAFAVAPQLAPEDILEAAKAGFRTLISNRPDNEGPAMTQSEAEAAAKAAGLVFHALPFAGAPTMDIAAETARLLRESEGPVLAYCRTGTRSTIAWAFAQALAGDMDVEAIVEAAAGAGYDLAPHTPVLQRLTSLREPGRS